MFINKDKSIIEIDSWKNWKTTVIMSWVHGNELSWVQIMTQLIPKVQVIKWKVIFIFANLKALNLNKRSYQKNMNRCFLKYNNWDSYEDKRSTEIMKYLDKSDYLLDLHNTINEENSIPFLISEYNDLWKYFDVNFSIKWFDELHPWWSDSYMNKLWKIWLCLESGSIYDKKSIDRAKKWIINFLKYTWNIQWKPMQYRKKEFISFNKIYKNQTMDFKFIKKFKDFEKIEKLQIIAYDGWVSVVSKNDSYILFPYKPNQVWDECFCLWKKIK